MTMETTIEVRPRSKTSNPQIVEAAAAVSALSKVRNDERAWALEKERKERELAAANLRAIELQDELDRLKKARADCQKEISRHLSGQEEINKRIADLEGQKNHIWKAGGEPLEHALKLAQLRELIRDVPKLLAEAEEQIPRLDAEIAAFEKKHVLK